MHRLVGPALMATGAVHLLAGLIFYPLPLAAIAQDGFFGAVELSPARFDREAAFWYMMSGAMFSVLGGLVHWAQARTGTLPVILGWSLLAIGVAGVILMPASGFWAISLLAALMLAMARRGRSGSAAEAGPVASALGNPGGPPS